MPSASTPCPRLLASSLLPRIAVIHVTAARCWEVLPLGVSEVSLLPRSQRGPSHQSLPGSVSAQLHGSFLFSALLPG